MEREDAIKWAIQAEKNCFEPELWGVDGSPYTSDPTDAQFWDVLAFLGNGECADGILYIESQIKARKENGEARANHECGNWMLWQIFIELGIPCQAVNYLKD